MRPRLAPLVLAAAAAVAYGSTLAAPPLYDDQVLVVNEALSRATLPEAAARVLSRDYFKTTGERSFQPLVTLFHHAVSDQPLVYRSVGILLHILNCLLVWALARQLGMTEKAALGAALAFSLFPPATETLNVSAFKGHLLAAGGSLACLLAWIRAWGAAGPARRRSVAGCHLAFLFALLSKESGLAALPLVAAWTGVYHPHAWRSALKRGGGLAFLAATYAVWRWVLLDPPPPLAASPGLLDRLALGWQSLGWYGRLTLLPDPLCLERSFSGAGPGAAARWLMPGALALLAWGLRRDKTALFGLAAFAAGLAPFLHLVPFANYSPVADRYLYLAAAGPCLLAGRLLDSRLRLIPYGLLLGWGCLTLLRNGIYLDERSLLEDTAACAPDNPRAHALLGAYRFHRGGDVEAAWASYGRAFSLDPRLRTLLVDPGLTHAQGPDYVRGLLHLRGRRFPEAYEALSRALRAERDLSSLAAIHQRLGDACLALARDEQALIHYRLAREAAPGWPLPFLKAGAVLRSREPREAASLLEAALSDRDRLPPFLTLQGLSFLGDAYDALDRKRDALRAWDQALRLDPENLDLLARAAEAAAALQEREGAASGYARLAAAAGRALDRLAVLSRASPERSRELAPLAEHLALRKRHAEQSLAGLTDAER